MTERNWQPFYRKFLSLIFGFMLSLTVFLINIQFSIFYLISRHRNFYIGYAVSSFAMMLLSVKYGRDYSELKDKLDLYLPYEESNIIPTVDEPEETSLKACYYYLTTHSLNGVSEALGFDFPIQAKREIIKGLDILLKSYEKQHGKEVLIA